MIDAGEIKRTHGAFGFVISIKGGFFIAADSLAANHKYITKNIINASVRSTAQENAQKLSFLKFYEFTNVTYTNLSSLD